MTAGRRDYAIFELDPLGFVTTWNAGAEHMQGYRAEEIIGQHVSIFYLRDRVVCGSPRTELARAARAGFAIDQDWRVRKDGSRFWAHVVTTAQRGPNGDLAGFLELTRDDTTLYVHKRPSGHYQPS
jgi:PAS domain S-box-containing protein